MYNVHHSSFVQKHKIALEAMSQGLTVDGLLSFLWELNRLKNLKSKKNDKCWRKTDWSSPKTNEMKIWHIHFFDN